jgi:hypothetical protein
MNSPRYIQGLLVALALSELACSLACMKPAGAGALVKCGPKPTREQAESVARSFCPRALGLPVNALIEDIQIVGPEKIYTGLVVGITCSYGWAITFQVEAKNAVGAYHNARKVTVVSSPDGKIHWKPEYGPGSD